MIEVLMLENYLVGLKKLFKTDNDKELIYPEKEVTDFLFKYAPNPYWKTLYQKYVLPTKRFDKITKLEQIQYYKAQGYSKNAIHKKTGISPNTIYKYYDQPLVVKNYQHDPFMEKALEDWKVLKKYLEIDIFACIGK